MAKDGAVVTATRKMTDDAREVIRLLAQEFTDDNTGESTGLLVLGGLSGLFEASLRHTDPKLAAATTAVRHVIDRVAHARVDELEDLQTVIRVALDIFLEGDGYGEQDAQ